MERELRLSLKRKWFDMTKEGIKTEDYRNVNEYWFMRLVFDYKKVFKYCTGHVWDYVDSDSRDLLIKQLFSDKIKRNMVGFVPFRNNTMTLGYPKSGDKERVLKLEHKGIEIRTGREEWGAEPNKLYFVIKHGEIIE